MSWAFCLRSLLSARRGGEQTNKQKNRLKQQQLVQWTQPPLPPGLAQFPDEQFQLSLEPIQEFHLVGSVSNTVIWSFSVCKCTCWAASLTALGSPRPPYPSLPEINDMCNLRPGRGAMHSAGRPTARRRRREVRFPRSPPSRPAPTSLSLSPGR